MISASAMTTTINFQRRAPSDPIVLNPIWVTVFPKIKMRIMAPANRAIF